MAQKRTTSGWARWLRRAALVVAVVAVGVVAVDVSAGALLRDKLDDRGLGQTVTFGRAQPRLSLDGATLRLSSLTVSRADMALAAEGATIGGVDPLSPDPMERLSVRLDRPELRLGAQSGPDWLSPLTGGQALADTVTVDWRHDPQAQRADLAWRIEGEAFGHVAVDMSIAGVSRAMLEAGLEAAAAVAAGHPPSAESIATIMPMLSSLALAQLSVSIEDRGGLRPILDGLRSRLAADGSLQRLQAAAAEGGEAGAVAAAIVGLLDGTTDRLSLHTTRDQPIALFERRGFIDWGPSQALTDLALFVSAAGVAAGEG
ncbi:MAG: hypothetical protein H6842_10995 [Rhodospirillaceae bacterium]|nr:hypothetical protein [Rhodospirillaceae bacterium]